MKEQLKEMYLKNSDTMKTDFIEWLVVCQYMNDDDFENLFRIEDLTEQEFFCVVEFLYRQECYILLFMLIARHLKRFKKEDIGFLEEISLRDCFAQRIDRLKDFKDFTVPRFL